MTGRIRRKLIAAAEPGRPADQDVVCPLCGRPIPASQRDEHHLRPKSEGGRATTTLHRICHRQIHALFTERELADAYFTIDALLAHAELAKFLRWVKHKPDDFFERTRKSARLRARS